MLHGCKMYIVKKMSRNKLVPAPERSDLMGKQKYADMSSTEFYTLHHSGCFRFPEEHRLILQRMFVTAAGNLDQKEIRVRIAGHKKYYEAKRECKLSGIRLEAVKISPFEYEYLATIRPKILLRQARKYVKTVRKQVSLTASVRPRLRSRGLRKQISRMA